MVEKVIMPKLEMAQETGKIVSWQKKEGERVEKGESLFTIETDKVTIDIESPASGILAGIRAQVGDEVPISTVIAFILGPGEELQGELADFIVAGPDIPVDASHNVSPILPVLVSPLARKMVKANNIDLNAITGTGARGQITKADVERFAALSIKRSNEGKIRATPAARRVAKQHGINLALLQGSGPRGRIHSDDIPASKSSFTAVEPLAGDFIPLDGMRKAIAQKMVLSYQTTPHINFTVRIDMSEIEKARQQANIEAQTLGVQKVTITAYVVMAVAWSLKRHPYLNSTLVDEEIHLLHDINIGVAVALDNGLIVPVIHNADRCGLFEISNRLNEITSHARMSKLIPRDVSDGTFTISNLGPFGIEQFTAIINPPQTAILAIGAIQREAIPDQNGQIIVKPIVHMTLSTDHRVIDGAIAARFLKDLKDMMEKEWLL